MPFQIGNGYFPDTISDSCITHIARSYIPPEISVLKKIKTIFCSTNRPETLECIQKICHPPFDMTRERVADRFEQLRALAHGSFKENVQSGRQGENHFCILDENCREMLSVTLNENGKKYTVKCQGYHKTHTLFPEIFAGYIAAKMVPQTAEDYEADWSAWERAAPSGEVTDRARVVWILRELQKGNSRTLDLSDLDISSLPAHLPPCIDHIQIKGLPLLASLPALSDGLKHLEVINTPLTSLPALPYGLKHLEVINTPLIRLPALPHGLTHLKVKSFPACMTRLPALPDGLTYLDVHNTYLTGLPALPHGLKYLDVSNTDLTNLLTLPNGLADLNVRNTSLTSLPPLPDGLTSLEVNNTPLTRLPELPDGLTSLAVIDTSLTSLPALPYGLMNLEVIDAPLTSLPALPDGLKHLAVNHTDLTSLPTLPDKLADLSVRNTLLTSLPALPHGLMRMIIDNTSVTCLPESITDLPSNARVDITCNPLSERTRQALEAMTHAPGYPGPRIEAGPSVPRKARLLLQAVADWLMPANGRMPASTKKWRAFGQENNAVSFSAFLDRLSETENVKKDAGFKAQTGAWLTQLAEDNELRAKTFAMATEAASSREDRVILVLNQMKNMQLVHNAEKGKYDNNLSGLISAGREMFRLETLEKIVRDKVSTLHFVDEIEVYLGYQNKLKETLALTSLPKEMKHFCSAHITESDLQAAERQVKEAENSQFKEWILQWAPFRGVLERTALER